MIGPQSPSKKEPSRMGASTMHSILSTIASALSDKSTYLGAGFPLDESVTFLGIPEALYQGP